MVTIGQIELAPDSEVTAITCARCGGNTNPYNRDNGRQHAKGACASCGGTGKMTQEQRAKWARRVMQ